MNKNFYRLLFSICAMLVFSSAIHAQRKQVKSIPYLQHQNGITQLMVDDKPFLVLGGELHNSSASGPEYMKSVWSKMKALNINTVVAPVYWELSEPAEGKFDFTLADDLIHGARENDIKLVLLWFGAWKNGYSTYAPAWVKTDLERFSRVKDNTGNSREILSVFDKDVLEAEKKAFNAFMKYLKKFDGSDRTVIMVQIENEVGILKDSRDRSEVADQIFNSQVPESLIFYLNKEKEDLLPEISDLWAESGYKKEGTWNELFKPVHSAEEVFMAWHYATYINDLAESGKDIYPLPMFVNAWGRQSSKQKPGGYPSGGPISAMIDIYRAGAPKIDFLSPDIYSSDFKASATKYCRSNNPLFIPETRRDDAAADRPFWVIGEMNGLGLAPFGIDNEEVKHDHPMSITYAMINDLSPFITKAMGTGDMHGFLEEDEVSEDFKMGNYIIRIQYQGSKSADKKGSGLVIQLSENTFLFAGRGYNVKFQHKDEDKFNTALLMVEEVKVNNGVLDKVMTLNGDETYGGTMLKLPLKEENRYSIQKASVYTYPATRKEGFSQQSFTVIEHPGFEGIWEVQVNMGSQGESKGDIEFIIENNQYKGNMRTPEYELPFEEVVLTKEGIQVAYSLQGFNIAMTLNLINNNEVEGNVADIYPLSGKRKSGPSLDPVIAEALKPFLGNWNVIVKNTPEGDVNGVLSIYENVSALSLKGEQFMVKKVELKEGIVTLHLPFQGYETTMQLELKDDQSFEGMLGSLYDISGTR